MRIVEALRERYAAKAFDSTKRVSSEDIDTIEALLHLSPSSANVQPWYYIVASTDEGRKRVASGTQGFFSFNEEKIINSSVVVLFCTKTSLSNEYMNKLIEQEDRDGRYEQSEFKTQNDSVRRHFADSHIFDFKDQQHWLDNQVYISIGTLLLGVAMMGLDAVPMEGFDAKALSDEFKLREKGLTPTCIVAIGYRAEDDFNAKLPKSRLTKADIIERI